MTVLSHGPSSFLERFLSPLIPMTGTEWWSSAANLMVCVMASPISAMYFN